MSKTYILQKDWPDAKVGDRYQWNGQGYSNQTRTSMVISKKYVEEYPEWFFKEEKKITLFQTKKIRDNWYCYATHRGYDYTFCSDNEYHAVELAKRIMDKDGWLAECDFPETLKTKPQAENKPDWEIVAFKMEDGQIIERQAKPNYDFCFFIKEGHKRGWIHESTCIEKYPIHSVKRLSGV